MDFNTQSSLLSQCAEDLLELGEAKSGVYSLLVEHVFGIWEGALASLPPAATPSGDSVPTPLPSSSGLLFQSLKDHSSMLMQMCLFGPVYKKNLR